MKRVLFLAALALLTGVAQAQRPTNDPQARKILLPNGWSLTPAGTALSLGDLPLNMQLAPGGKMLAVTNNGQGKQKLQLVDPVTEKLLDERPIGKAWYGLAFSAKGDRLYASGGNDNIILAYPTAGRKLGAPDTLRLGPAWPKAKISPAGIAVDAAGQRLYTVTKEDSTLYVLDLKTGRTLRRVKLGYEAYGCLLSADNKTVYATLWGGDKLLAYDRATGRIRATLATGSHPNELIQSRNGRYLFVANANDNSVSVVDVKSWKVLETIATALYPTRLTGSTTNGLALAADEKTLYIANADNNCLAVFDVSHPGHSAARGFIPTGWYPTCVRTLGSKLLVANGKGFSSQANPGGPQPVKKTDSSGHHLGNGLADGPVQYIGSLFIGTLSFIPVPDAARLKSYSQQVYANTPFTKEREKLALGEAGNPVPRRAGEKSPIKHVFYIIKENRTYDQIFGDVREGEGDSSLCIFPRKVTPNHHALARDFVLLDNFYVNAEVSADGHNWSTAAYATDYVEKSWPISYGGRGGTYDFEGTRKIAYPRDGFIWDYCQRAGLSYRTYGEFAELGKTPLKSLRGHVCPRSPGFDLDVKDVERVRIWAQDFDSLLAVGKVPQLSTIRLSNDHTSGQRLGKVSPVSAVADNDLALGQLVEHIAHSRIWGESVIFVLEDDAQNGPDHIDAHRSPALVIGPYVRRQAVDHTLYTTAGVMRTIELLLGLPPMSQYDAAARPLFGLFQAAPNATPYQAKAAQVSLDTRNTAWNRSAERSAKFDFAHEDAVPDLDLNEVVWKSVKGEQSAMPAPRRGAFLQLTPKRKDDDE
ncbi:bifunctional YncE family protein/alkaline phosphatase family protein [Hymenobacter sp. BRD67]|uniref:bifunctional YncE family protein/alkaline phosphatase family protein n=1 Tax=Hymenobacter sp. BRD67 TaxID=2675877 RepID=UPI0015634BCB|nr:alkaline phosphatase family protein [Hymenobacter sp. BRD67]QKG52261.1 beta-propeller fold lactonase family protein [Hymenobacter sp. BRD67]